MKRVIALLARTIRTISCCLLLATMHISTAMAQHLLGGQSLSTGQTMQSANKGFFLIVQTDGNVCVYRGQPQAQLNAIWCLNRVASGGQFVLAMQKDGNLCEYVGTTSGYSRNLWCSNTQTGGRPVVLAMQDDGNLCVYRGTPSGYEQALWCTQVTAAPAPPPLPPRLAICATPKCGVGGVEWAGTRPEDTGPAHNCTLLAQDNLRQICAERNRKYEEAKQGAQAACPLGKGQRVCIAVNTDRNLPAIPNSAAFDRFAVSSCTATMPTTCQDLLPEILRNFVYPGTQLQTCSQEPRSNQCLAINRLNSLCGINPVFSTQELNAVEPPEMFADQLLREECIVRAKRGL